MKNQVKVAMENKGDMIFTAIPVEHLVVNSIDAVKELLIKCAKKMYSTGIISWNSLKIYRNNLMS